MDDHDISCEEGLPAVTVEDLKGKMERKEDIVLLDVRACDERETARIPGAVLIPLGELPGRLRELEGHRNRSILVYYQSGFGSAQAVKFLRERGFAGAADVTGGLDAWSERIDSPVH